MNVEVVKGLDVKCAGKGRPLVLIHSLLSDRDAFAPILQNLVRERYVIALNLPGFGKSPAAPPDFEIFADRIQSTLTDLAITERVDLLGNGFGSFVALTLAAKYPQLVRKMILVGAGARFSDEGRQKFTGMSIAVKQGGMAAIANTAMLRLFPPQFISNNPVVVEERRQVLLKINPEFFAAAAEMLAKADLTELATSVEAETVIMAGHLDQATTVEMARELKGIVNNSLLVEMPNLGHMPQLQDPAEFMRLLAPHIRAE